MNAVKQLSCLAAALLTGPVNLEAARFNSSNLSQEAVDTSQTELVSIDHSTNRLQTEEFQHSTNDILRIQKIIEENALPFAYYELYSSVVTCHSRFKDSIKDGAIIDQTQFKEYQNAITTLDLLLEPAVETWKEIVQAKNQLDNLEIFLHENFGGNAPLTTKVREKAILLYVNLDDQRRKASNLWHKKPSMPHPTKLIEGVTQAEVALNRVEYALYFLNEIQEDRIVPDSSSGILLSDKATAIQLCNAVINAFLEDSSDFENAWQELAQVFGTQIEVREALLANQDLLKATSENSAKLSGVGLSVTIAMFGTLLFVIASTGYLLAREEKYIPK